MSDLITELEQFAITAGEQLGLKLAKLAWDRLTGGDVGGDEAAIKAIAEHTAQVAKAVALTKARELAELVQAEIVQGVDDLLAKAEDVLASFMPPALPSVPPLGVDIEMVPPDAPQPPFAFDNSETDKEKP